MLPPSVDPLIKQRFGSLALGLLVKNSYIHLSETTRNSSLATPVLPSGGRVAWVAFLAPKTRVFASCLVIYKGWNKKRICSTQRSPRKPYNLSLENNSILDLFHINECPGCWCISKPIYTYVSGTVEETYIHTNIGFLMHRRKLETIISTVSKCALFPSLMLHIFTP